MSLLDPKQPLWLPEGSIRALLAGSLVGSLVVMALRGDITPDQYVPVAVMAVGFYFMDKAGQAPSE